MLKNLTFLCLPIVLLASVLLATPSGTARADESPAAKYTTIETPAGGEPMLVIRYPWVIHKKPSVEVRTYIPAEVESARIRPLMFVHGFMKDKITVKVYEVEDAASGTATKVEFNRRGIDFTAVGDRNLLGRPSVCVTCETEVLKPNKEAFHDKSRWAIYPLLEEWAPDKRTLFLSLPKASFTTPVKIRVFFLRDADTIWTEALDWPGLGEADPAPTAKSAQPQPSS